MPTGRSSIGAAHHAAGEWEKAIDALGKANTLHGGGEAWDLFPLAMSQWQLGQRDEARRSYDEAVEYMEQHRFNDPVLPFLQREAAELLGVTPEETTDTDATSDAKDGTTPPDAESKPAGAEPVEANPSNTAEPTHESDN